MESFIISLMNRLQGRLIGGAVRDIVLKRPIKDYDLATPLLPSEVVSLLKPHYPLLLMGYDYGTVTVLIQGHPIEVTTLRRDLETDGRHAKVSFSTSWEEDAQRRDFTFNALSMDSSGKIYDYTRGIQDAKDGRVRFIGNPHQRIQEDYLRVLRFFRFYAHYGAEPPDPLILDALKAHKEGLKTLSLERKTKEIFCLLEAPCPQDALRYMMQTHVLEEVLPGEIFLPDQFLFSDPLWKLAYLFRKKFPWNSLRLSKKQVVLLKRYFAGNQIPLKKLLYDYGKVEGLKSASLFLENPQQALQESLKWTYPSFPLSAQDALDLNLKGQKLGEVLETTKKWWLEQDSPPSKHECLTFMKALLAK